MNDLNEKIEASIFIPTKNPGPEFKDILKGIFDQKKVNFELIVVDSGSNEQVLKMMSDYPLQLFQIRPEEFGHGKTRNLALKYVKGDYVVFMTQDATPGDNFWLRNLLDGFTDGKVAGVFSRQIPKADARGNEIFFYSYHFPDKFIIRPNPRTTNPLDKNFFSNVSSCLKKEIFAKYPFDESLIMSEDQQWSKEVIEAGYKTVYNPNSIVVHSHNYNLRQTFARYFDSSFSLRQIVDSNFRMFTKTKARYAVEEFWYALKKSPHKIFYLFLFNLARTAGTFAGWRAESFPVWIKKRISMHSYYWN